MEKNLFFLNSLFIIVVLFYINLNERFLEKDAYKVFFFIFVVRFLCKRAISFNRRVEKLKCCIFI